MPIEQIIAEAEEQLRKINQQTSDGAVAVNQLRLEQEGVQAGIDRLTKLKEEAQKQLDEVNSSLDAASTTRANVLGTLEDLHRQVSAAQSELKSTLTKNEQALIDGTNEIENHHKEQQAITGKAREELAAIEKQKEEIEKQLAPLTEQLSRLQIQITESESKLSKLNVDIDEKTKAVENAIIEVENAKAETERVQSEVQEIEDEISQRGQEADDLLREVDKKTSELETLEKQIQESESSLEKNNTENADFLKDRATVVALDTEYKQRLEKLKIKYGELGESWD